MCLYVNGDLQKTFFSSIGKTTFLQHLGQKNRQYVTLDDPLLRHLAKTDPALFMQKFPPPLLIDEIQYAPELLPLIKMAVDTKREAGLFWLTGSQQFQMMKNVSESLAGRIGLVELLGLSLKERLGQGDKALPFLPTPQMMKDRESLSEKKSLKDIYQMIWQGSYPMLAMDSSMNRDLFYSSYVQTYLQRDVRDLAKVGDEMSFLRFLRAAAARSGQLLNLSDLARDADISPGTAKSWLSILQSSGLVHLLYPYHSNMTKRLVKAPKLYFFDTGLCAYLTTWSSPEALEAGAMSGALLETWVVGEIIKSWWHNGQKGSFYYYRDKDQQEVDLLIFQDGIFFLVEIKKTSAPRADVLKHRRVLKKNDMPIGSSCVVCFVEQYLPLADGVSAVPVWMI